MFVGIRDFIGIQTTGKPERFFHISIYYDLIRQIWLLLCSFVKTKLNSRTTMKNWYKPTTLDNLRMLWLFTLALFVSFHVTAANEITVTATAGTMGPTLYSS